MNAEGSYACAQHAPTHTYHKQTSEVCARVIAGERWAKLREQAVVALGGAVDARLLDTQCVRNASLACQQAIARRDIATRSLLMTLASICLSSFADMASVEAAVVITPPARPPSSSATHHAARPFRLSDSSSHRPPALAVGHAAMGGHGIGPEGLALACDSATPFVGICDRSHAARVQASVGGVQAHCD